MSGAKTAITRITRNKKTNGLARFNPDWRGKMKWYKFRIPSQKEVFVGGVWFLIGYHAMEIGFVIVEWFLK